MEQEWEGGGMEEKLHMLTNIVNFSKWCSSYVVEIKLRKLRIKDEGTIVGFVVAHTSCRVIYFLLTIFQFRSTFGEIYR